MMTDKLTLSGLTRGERARVKRVALGWRQVDVAAAARTTVESVIDFEKERDVPDAIAARITEALGL